MHVASHFIPLLNFSVNVFLALAFKIYSIAIGSCSHINVVEHVIKMMNLAPPQRLIMKILPAGHFSKLYMFYNNTEHQVPELDYIGCHYCSHNLHSLPKSVMHGTMLYALD